SRIDVETGQFVLAREPVGTMSGTGLSREVKSEQNAPVLYIEFRKDGRPVDPDPWWAKGLEKVED
ncbi:MAG: peptidase M23, partial [Hyphomicrobiaceae bacterium]